METVFVRLFDTSNGVSLCSINIPVIGIMQLNEWNSLLDGASVS